MLRHYSSFRSYFVSGGVNVDLKAGLYTRNGNDQRMFVNPDGTHTVFFVHQHQSNPRMSSESVRRICRYPMRISDITHRERKNAPLRVVAHAHVVGIWARQG